MNSEMAFEMSMEQDMWKEEIAKRIIKRGIRNDIECDCRKERGISRINRRLWLVYVEESRRVEKCRWKGINMSQ